MAFLPILGAIGAIASAAGSVVGGIAQGNAAAYQAKVAENNAKIAQQNAAYAAHAGEANAEAQSRKGAARQAAIKAAMAANGIDVNTGSDLNVQESAREESNLDTLNVQQNANLQVYGYRTQATNFEAQAELDRQEAQQAPIGGLFGAAGSLLSNASSIGLGKGGFGSGVAATTYSGGGSGGIGSDWVAGGVG